MGREVVAFGDGCRCGWNRVSLAVLDGCCWVLETAAVAFVTAGWGSDLTVTVTGRDELAAGVVVVEVKAFAAFGWEFVAATGVTARAPV